MATKLAYYIFLRYTHPLHNYSMVTFQCFLRGNSRVTFNNIYMYIPIFFPRKRGLVFTGRYFLGYDIFGTPWMICPRIFNPITASFGLMTPKYAFYSRMRGGRGNLTKLTKLAYPVVSCTPGGSGAGASFYERIK